LKAELPDFQQNLEAWPGLVQEHCIRLGIKPKTLGYFLEACTHSSRLNEMGGSLRSNERLEHLGDAVLGAVASDLLFNAHPDLAEGPLAKLKGQLVSAEGLAPLAAEIGLSKLLLLGRGEEKSGGRLRGSLLADAFEAWVGALYLDQGFMVVKDFLKPLLNAKIKSLNSNDPKSKLQEVLHRMYQCKPVYVLENMAGPDHDKLYWVTVFAQEKILGKGKGPNKKAAEKAAALGALKKLRPSYEGESGADSV
jgi:ribonuclease-3